MRSIGQTETIVGKAIKGIRDEIVLAIKVRGRTGSGPNDEGPSREHILHNIEMSLKRLGTEHVDDRSTAPTIGASKLEQLEENIEVLDHTLHAEAVKRINEVSKPYWLGEQREQPERLRRAT